MKLYDTVLYGGLQNSFCPETSSLTIDVNLSSDDMNICQSKG